jgi:hypothetical protein
MWYSFHKNSTRIHVVSDNWLIYKETKKRLILHDFCINASIIFSPFEKPNFGSIAEIDFRQVPSECR